jgi:single-strand DNA-binding protein
MNKVILLGRLVKDPEIRYTQSADPACVAKFTLAVGKRFKKEGEPDADFIQCVSFRNTAEFMEKYIKKGMMVSVCGSLSVRSYEDNTGQRKWATEVSAAEVNFAESKAAYEARMAAGGGKSGNESYGFTAVTQSIDEDDDLPF